MLLKILYWSYWCYIKWLPLKSQSFGSFIKIMLELPWAPLMTHWAPPLPSWWRSSQLSMKNLSKAECSSYLIITIWILWKAPKHWTLTKKELESKTFTSQCFPHVRKLERQRKGKENNNMLKRNKNKISITRKASPSNYKPTSLHKPTNSKSKNK